MKIINIKTTEERRKFIINIVYYAIIAVLLLLILKYTFNWISPFLLGFTAALAVRKPVVLISERTGISRRFCGVCAIILLYIIIGVFIYFAGAYFIDWLVDFINGVPEFYNDSISPALESLNDAILNFTQRISDSGQQEQNTIKGINDGIADLLVGISGGIIKYLTDMSGQLPTLFMSALFAVMSSVFISMDFDKIMTFIKNKIPANQLDKIQGAYCKTKITLKNYFKGYFIVMILTFVQLLAGFYIIKANNPFLLAALISVADALPVIGYSLIIIPWIFIEILKGQYAFALSLSIMYVIITIILEILRPKIMGKQLGQHPLLTLIAIFVGFRLMGVLGVIAAPIIVQVIIDYVRDSKI